MCGLYLPREFRSPTADHRPFVLTISSVCAYRPFLLLSASRLTHDDETVQVLVRQREFEKIKSRLHYGVPVFGGARPGPIALRRWASQGRRRPLQALRWGGSLTYYWRCALIFLDLQHAAILLHARYLCGGRWMLRLRELDWV